MAVAGGGTTACASQPCLLNGACQNGGACIAGEGPAFRCECVGAFFGDRCEEAPPCAAGSTQSAGGGRAGRGRGGSGSGIYIGSGEQLCLNGGVCSDWTTDKLIKKLKAGGEGGFYCQCQAR